MNEERLRQVANYISKYPMNFDMFSFVAGNDILSTANAGNCGTTACIAGWSIIAEKGLIEKSEPHDEEDNFFNQGKRALGLTNEQANKLFYLTNWPAKYLHRHNSAIIEGKYDGCAQIAVERIEHFIAHGE